MQATGSDNRFSTRVRAAAVRLRALADEVERAQRNHTEGPVVEEAFVRELSEIIRRVEIRLAFDRGAEELLHLPPAEMRQEAARLEEIAEAARSKALFKPTAREMRGCSLWILAIATAGGALLWFRIGPTWLGAGLLIVAAVSVAALIGLKSDVE